METSPHFYKVWNLPPLLQGVELPPTFKRCDPPPFFYKVCNLPPLLQGVEPAPHFYQVDFDCIYTWFYPADGIATHSH